jgi:hypothetical protein
VTGALLALALAAVPALHQEEWEAPYGDQAGEQQKRLFLSAWGGDSFDISGSGRTSGTLGGEVAWAFDQLDVGVAGYGYHGLTPVRAWTPVGMLRLTQRFTMRTGVEATFGLGLGAGRVTGWEAWFQVALGVRLPLGPLFLGGELAFERQNILALRAALGLAF